MIRRILRESIILCVIGLFLAVSANCLRSQELPWQEDWDQKLRGGEMVEESISLPDAYDLFNKRSALFVDARGPESYKRIHIPGAVNLPFDPFVDDMPEKAATLPKDRLLVLYCSTQSCLISHDLASMLKDLGYTQVRVLVPGLMGWKTAGYPLEKSDG
ncbi:MAG: rhodanese-like domain-containing protein [Desulfovibrio sp.]|uniref:rhodanese-like domain-containing protein n=1 Tax=Desulfovibrio sp. 7SRBS1 TaxID=3378064 RepID=UPI003B3EEA6D